MNWLSDEIAKIPRFGKFPFRVNLLFFCQDQIYRDGQCRNRTREDAFEINIRLNADHEICRDIINGEEICERFPHAVWKMPGGEHRLQQGTVRDTIAFGYPAALLEKFRELGLLPERCSRAFILTEEIRRHISEFRKLCRELYSPGAADRIDWVCFQLCREICYANTGSSELQTDADRIRNISVWLQQHLHEPIDLDEVIAANGFSRASFFRRWKEVFRVTPIQYLLDMKIERAAKLLLTEPDLPISEIISEIRYSGPTAFYRRFARRYGMTPDEYRRTRS